MTNLENDKNLYRFMKHIEFIRRYFKGGSNVGFVNPEHIHEQGITREEAEIMYTKECEKRKKFSRLPYRIKDSITGRVRMVLDDNYKTLLELMDILHRDFIDEKDLDNILSNVKVFYNKHYQCNTTNEELTK